MKKIILVLFLLLTACTTKTDKANPAKQPVTTGDISNNNTDTVNDIAFEKTVDEEVYYAMNLIYGFYECEYNDFKILINLYNYSDRFFGDMVYLKGDEIIKSEVLDIEFYQRPERYSFLVNLKNFADDKYITKNAFYNLNLIENGFELVYVEGEKVFEEDLTFIKSEYEINSFLYGYELLIDEYLEDFNDGEIVGTWKSDETTIIFTDYLKEMWIERKVSGKPLVLYKGAYLINSEGKLVFEGTKMGNRDERYKFVSDFQITGNKLQIDEFKEDFIFDQGGLKEGYYGSTVYNDYLNVLYSWKDDANKIDVEMSLIGPDSLEETYGDEIVYYGNDVYKVYQKGEELFWIIGKDYEISVIAIPELGKYDGQYKFSNNFGDLFNNQ